MKDKDVGRFSIIIDGDKVVVDTDIPIETLPNWDIYKNSHFTLRRRCLEKFLKAMEKLLVRKRVAKRLILLKNKLA